MIRELASVVCLSVSISAQVADVDVFFGETDQAAARRAARAAVVPIGETSPDGELVVFVSVDDGDAEIMLARVDGSERRQLTHNDAIDNHPDWSPDGRRIAFASTRSGTWQIYEMGADGSGQRQLTDGERRAWHPKYGPDGRLAFLLRKRADGKSTTSDLVLMDAEGLRVLVADARITDFAWRSDGKAMAVGVVQRIVFLDLERGTSVVHELRELDERMHHHGVGDLEWTPAGDAVRCHINFAGGRFGDGHVFGDDEDFEVSLAGELRVLEPGAPAR